MLAILFMKINVLTLELEMTKFVLKVLRHELARGCYGCRCHHFFDLLHMLTFHPVMPCIALITAH